MNKQWFDVDKAGLGQTGRGAGKGRLIGELIQNGLDEAGVTQIAVTLALVPGRPLADLTVEDDSPEGFRDLTHAYTLFAPSYKRGNPEQRGQFNLGEKMVLAVCESASISTTKGTVVFDPDEGRIEKPRQKRERGSVFQGRIKMTREEYPQVCDYLRSLLLPENVVVTFNGDRLLPRKPLRTFEASLETLVADDQGVMRPTGPQDPGGHLRGAARRSAEPLRDGLAGRGNRRQVARQHCARRCHSTGTGTTCGPPTFKLVRVAVLNAAYDLLTTDEEATAGWCKLAGSDERCSDEAIKHLIRLRFGEKVAAPDPSDIEAMKAFQSRAAPSSSACRRGSGPTCGVPALCCPQDRFAPRRSPTAPTRMPSRSM